MNPALRSPQLFAGACALAFAAFACLSSAPPVRAAIETDPQALYTTMKHAYDQGATKAWTFRSERYYLSTILDAGRAYSLFRPTDPNYGEVAELAVVVATQLHYDPLTNDDAALWYVLEASNDVAVNGDATHQTEARALLARLSAIGDDPKSIAGAAESDAAANAAEFHGDGDALVDEIVADVRAYGLTHDATYRSLLLQHAADPANPIWRVPDPEYGVMFAIASSALVDPGFTEADRSAARAIAYRRAHEPELKTIARINAFSHDLRLTETAPADEYFGRLKFSPIGVRNEVVRINKYLDKGWGYRMESDSLQVENAVSDWQKQYPHDRTLPAALLETYRLLQRVETEKTERAAEQIKTTLLVQYAASRQAQELAAS